VQPEMHNDIDVAYSYVLTCQTDAGCTGCYVSQNLCMAVFTEFAASGTQLTTMVLAWCTNPVQETAQQPADSSKICI
jgi:hypothetical protein